MIKDTQDTQDYQKICPDRKPQVKVNDIISLKIYDTYNKDLDYHIITQVIEVTQKTIRLKDIKLIKEPNSYFDNGNKWNLNFGTLNKNDVDSYKFVLLGTTETHPEYLL